MTIILNGFDIGKPKEITPVNLKYIDKTNTYDACHYEITALVKKNNIPKMERGHKLVIELTVTKSKEMNVYVYGGLNGLEQHNALKPIIEGNNPVEMGKPYSIEYQ